MMRQALVTGGAQGIGHAVARSLARQGWDVTIADIDAAKIERALVQWRTEGFSIDGVAIDITDTDAVASLMDRMEALDVVVNNAAIAAKLLPFREIDRGAFEAMLRVNVGGMFNVSREAASRMKGGAIVNISSRGYLGGAGGAHYVASKAAVVAMTRALAVELRWRGIAVNAVAPGMVETRMIADFTDTMRSRLSALDPQGAPLSPQCIADVVLFLASDGGRGLSGQVLLADGGKSLGIEPF